MPSEQSESAIEQSDEPLETLAHRLWTHWSMRLAEEENISEERLNRWERNWVPFNELDEPAKDADRRLVSRFCEETPDYGGDSNE